MTTAPIAALLIILDFAFIGATPYQLIMEIGCSVLVIPGFTMFLYGVDIGVIPMGKAVGLEMARKKSIWLLIATVLIIGVVATIAEPDVSVFCTTAEKVFPSLDPFALTLSISVGVGVMLIVAALRMLYNISIRFVITVGYMLVIMLGISSSQGILGIAFDSGGVTTGPITIPVVLAIGLGIGLITRHGSGTDSFGMIGLASIGPLVCVMLYGLISEPATTSAEILNNVKDGTVSMGFLLDNLESSLLEVAISVGPLYTIFLILQKSILHCTWRDFWIMSWGFLFTSLGMVMFLTGVYSGFMPLAETFGTFLVNNDAGIWILVIGVVFGFLVIVAEPAVKILGTQVELMTSGELNKKDITTTVAIGVSVTIGVGMWAMSQGLLSVYDILVLYAIAIVLLWIMDRRLIGIAYDAGGVATGPMSVAIIMTLYASIAQTAGPDIASSNAFGGIALIALAPILSISILGIYTRFKNSRNKPSEE